ncbi:hypothetical protein BDF14DRAFT_1745795 [Spinellus fusiger]|nr:hypothetical protein BDF14DRAFT_1745795 [Spinellus fusiger]
MAEGVLSVGVDTLDLLLRSARSTVCEVRGERLGNSLAIVLALGWYEIIGPAEPISDSVDMEVSTSGRLVKTKVVSVCSSTVSRGTVGASGRFSTFMGITRGSVSEIPEETSTLFSDTLASLGKKQQYGLT